MKFNEFKNPQLTEEQIVLSYCKGEITKEDAVSRLREAPQDSKLDKLTKQNMAKGSFNSKDSKAAGGSFFDRMGRSFRKLGSAVGIADSPQVQARQDAQATIKKQDRVAAADLRKKVGDKEFFSRLSVGPKTAQAATPKLKNPVTKDPNRTIGDLRVTGPVFVNKADKPAAKKKAPVAPTAANTRDYDKTMALPKKLIAQGANIQADGLMGPNTRAAMKAAGMGAKKPVAKKKLSGPERLSRLADIPAVSRALGARGELSKDDGEFADPNAMTRRKPKVAPKKKPRTLGKQNSKMPKSFGGFGPRVDDPKGGETVNLPFGMSYKTLPEKDRDSAFGDN